MKLAPATMMIALLFCGSGASAQTATTAKTTIEAYGARLNNPADTTAKLNGRRINNRIENRLDNRLATRIERYRVGSAADPISAFQRIEQGSTTQAFEQADTAGRSGILTPTPPVQYNADQQDEASRPRR